MTAPIRARVLHVSTVHPPFDSRIFGMEVRALAALGYDVSIAMTVNEPASAGSISIIPLGENGGPRFRRLARNFRALKAMLGRYDIVHVHDPELLIAAACARLVGRRIIYDVHEFYFEKFERGDVTAGWIPRPILPLVRFAYATFERALLPSVAGIVVVSEEMIAHYQRFIDASRIALVRNFPNLREKDCAAARKAPPPLPGPYVVHTGGASKDRAFDVVIDAAERLRKLGQEAPIINLGPVYLKDYPSAARAQLLERARSADVRVVGPVSYADTLRWLAHASVAYMPLRSSKNNARGQPRKLFEYFAFGLPVVAPDFGRVKTIVERCDAGLVVPAEDAAAHAAALNALLSSAHARAKYGGQAAAASHMYTFAPEASRLASLYETVLQKANGARSRRRIALRGRS